MKQITAGSQTASNQQTAVTNAAMAQRGISNDSTLAQQNLQNALLPVGAQYGGLLSQAGLSEQQDLGQIASQIAALQSGNVPQAINTASGLANLQQQSNQFQATLPSTIALQQAEAQAAGYIPVSPGASIYNISGQNYSNPLASILRGLGINLTQ